MVGYCRVWDGRVYRVVLMVSMLTLLDEGYFNVDLVGWNLFLFFIKFLPMMMGVLNYFWRYRYASLVYLFIVGVSCENDSSR